MQYDFFFIYFDYMFWIPTFQHYHFAHLNWFLALGIVRWSTISIYLKLLFRTLRYWFILNYHNPAYYKWKYLQLVDGIKAEIAQNKIHNWMVIFRGKKKHKQQIMPIVSKLSKFFIFQNSNLAISNWRNCYLAINKRCF